MSRPADPREPQTHSGGSAQRKNNADYLGLTFWKAATRLSKGWIQIQKRFGLVSYPRWLAAVEKEHLKETGRMKPGTPETGIKVGLLLTAGGRKADLSRMEDSLRSLIGQSSPAWEAWVRLDAGDEAAAQRLSGWIATDARIHCRAADPHQGLLSWMAAALDGQALEWVCLMEWGDCLTPGYLQSVSRWIAQRPDWDAVYCDEDRITRSAPRMVSAPWFKPDWSPELMLSANLLRHALIRRDLTLDADLMAADPVGIEQFSFWIAEKAKAIGHMPCVGVHCACEMVPGDPARLAAVNAHLCRIGIDGGEAVLGERGQIQVTWPPGDSLASIIIPTRDKVEYLQKCVRSLQEGTHYPDIEIVIADTGSQDAATLDYYQHLAADPRVRILYDREPFNFSRVNNWAARQAHGEILVFLNNDVQATEPDWLDELVRWAKRPEIGVVGAKLLYPDGRLQHAGIILGMEGHASHVFSRETEGAAGPFGSSDWYRDYSAVTGACLAMRQSVFEELGGFDERFVVAFGDVEICQRAIRKGYRVLYTPYARLIHHEGRTRANYIPLDDIQVGFEELGEAVSSGDPYYNPNLSTSVRVPTLRQGWEESSTARLQKIVRLAAIKTRQRSL
jgi:O-antigen biosynthesis protein